MSRVQHLHTLIRTAIGAGPDADESMDQVPRPDDGLDFEKVMRIALDANCQRDLRIAAEALVSAMLNGASEIRAEAVEILVEENEMQAVEALSQIIANRNTDH